MNTVSLTLPQSLQEQVEALAQKEGISVPEFITLAVAEKLATLATAARCRRFRRRAPNVPLVEPPRLALQEARPPPLDHPPDQPHPGRRDRRHGRRKCWAAWWGPAPLRSAGRTSQYAGIERSGRHSAAPRSESRRIRHGDRHPGWCERHPRVGAGTSHRRARMPPPDQYPGRVGAGGADAPAGRDRAGAVWRAAGDASTASPNADRWPATARSRTCGGLGSPGLG